MNNNCFDISVIFQPTIVEINFLFQLGIDLLSLIYLTLNSTLTL